jgi:hypothetical protein
MRIGQLARRLALPPSDLMAYLAGQNVAAESGPETGANSRLSDEQVAMIVSHFAPEKLSEIIAVAQQEVVEAPPAPAIVEKEEVVVDVVTSVVEEIKLEDIQPEPLEVIRVAKVELQGLKVLGKIELPQPKKKTETSTEGDAPVGEEQPSEERPRPVVTSAPRREFPKRNERRERTWKNPLEQQRQRQAEEAERKRQEQLERQKEKKANHYYSKVKSVPTKAVRRLEEQVVVEDIEVKQEPKSVIGKFFRWLTS